VLEFAGFRAVLAELWKSIQTWPWSMVAAIFGIAAFSVLIWVNFLRPKRRRIKLRRPVIAHFIVAAAEHHSCEFAKQDGREHWLKTIVLPSNKTVIVDVILDPLIYFVWSELSIGCEGNLTDKPYATEYLNRFIEVGEGKNVIPGKGNRHYIDKYHYYHLRDQLLHMSIGSTRSIAFKIQTGKAGVYPAHIYFFGDEVEGLASDLLIIVEDIPSRSMTCIHKSHRQMNCAQGGILPV
jgi:hypothetical protein